MSLFLENVAVDVQLLLQLIKQILYWWAILLPTVLRGADCVHALWLEYP